MNVKLLNKVLKEIKEELNLDYALNKGLYSPSCTSKILEETYGTNSKGIYVRWFGKNQEQPLRKELDKLYINHNLDDVYFETIKYELYRILSTYYKVEWDFSIEKTILIKEKEL